MSKIAANFIMNKRIFRPAIAAVLLLALVAGCASTPETIRPNVEPTVSDERVFTVGHTIPEGVDRSGAWIGADARVVRVARPDVISRLGLRWEINPASDAGAARFIPMTAEQAVAFSTDRGVKFEETNDPAGLLMARAGTPMNFSRPQFYVRHADGSMFNIEIEGNLTNDHERLALTVSATQLRSGHDSTLGEWTGSAVVQPTGAYILIEIPTEPFRIAGDASERLMVMVVPRLFRWQHGRLITTLPWGRRRVTEIVGDNITNTWVPASHE